jgi:hypothetical protein
MDLWRQRVLLPGRAKLPLQVVAIQLWAGLAQHQFLHQLQEACRLLLQEYLLLFAIRTLQALLKWSTLPLHPVIFETASVSLFHTSADRLKVSAFLLNVSTCFQKNLIPNFTPLETDEIQRRQSTRTDVSKTWLYFLTHRIRNFSRLS